MDTSTDSSLIQPTFQDASQGIVTEQVQPSYGSSTYPSSMASINVLQQAYNIYQDTEYPQATLQSFPDQPMEWTQDDLFKEIMENLDEKNMSPQSPIDFFQEANNYYQDTEQPEVMLRSLRAQPTEWTEDDLEEIMENLDEDTEQP
ncbi:hypothetical protein Tco_1333638 [Tanacetum coccineum]